MIDDATGLPVFAPINTIAGGTFLFSGNVPDGTYYLTFNYNAVNPDYIVTIQDVSGANTQATDVDDDSDTDVAAPHATHLITLAGGQLEENIGMGLFLPASINGEVWEDLNGDGLDGGEPNTPVNVNVSLLDANTLALVANDANGNPLTNPVSTNSTYSLSLIHISEPTRPY